MIVISTSQSFDLFYKFDDIHYLYGIMINLYFIYFHKEACSLYNDLLAYIFKDSNIAINHLGY